MSFVHQLRHILLLIIIFLSGASSRSQAQPDKELHTHIPVLQVQIPHSHSGQEQQETAVHAGYKIPVNYTPSNCGEWSHNSNERLIWTLTVQSAGAAGINIFLSDIQLPQNSSLRIISVANRDDQYLVVREDERHSDYLQSPVFTGESLILEYIVPAKDSSIIPFHLMAVGHFHRFSDQMDSDGTRGGECAIDINCAEGLQWQNEKRSVVNLSIPFGNGLVSICSGVLVRNTTSDIRNYIITSRHCIEDSDEQELLLSSTRFNWENTECGTSSSTLPNTRTGLVLRATSTTGSGNTGSDFALLEMTKEIPEEWAPYYAGWDISGTVPVATEGDYVATSIFHSGSVKKISVTNDVSSGSYYPQPIDGFWEVYWASSTNGWSIPEGGSSGAPLFNSDHRVIGTHTGGTSGCSSLNGSSLFGKFSIHWNGNTTNPENQDLVDWLDPDNTGITFMDGAFLEITPPSVTAQSSDTLICTGSQLSLTVSALGTGPLTYEWSLNGEVIPDEDSATITIDESSAGDSGIYSCTIDGPGSSSAVATIEVVVSDNCSCPGDFSGNGYIDESDVQLLYDQFNCTGECSADINGDNLVDVLDLTELLGNFGATCE